MVEIYNFIKKEGSYCNIFLSLGGKIREAALKISIDDIDRDDGVETLITELDKLFLNDKLHLAY